jgi:hypothetical protein
MVVRDQYEICVAWLFPHLKGIDIDTSPSIGDADTGLSEYFDVA